MRRWRLRCVMLLLATVIAERGAADTRYVQLPLSFEPNVGQTNDAVKFLARVPGYAFFITSRGSTLVLDSASGSATRSILRVEFAGSQPPSRVAGTHMLPGKVNYFTTSDPGNWRTEIPTYRGVVLEHIYPGIDVSYYGNPQQLEYDFIVAPGANPSAIRLRFSGAAVKLDAAGNLLLETPAGTVISRAPEIYQNAEGRRVLVEGRYVVIESPLGGDELVGFEVGAYDRQRPLVIDPTLAYSTFLGGGGNEQGFDVAVDASGHAYVTGNTGSVDYPTASAYDSTFNNSFDVFVTKLTPDGSQLVYSTYIGGSSYEYGRGIAVDASGNAYIGGYTGSTDFPIAPFLKPGPFDASYNGGAADAFVAKLSASGSSLIYSTFLGGSLDDFGYAIAIDSLGRAYLTGETASANYPVAGLKGVHDLTHNGGSDVFVSRLAADGLTLTYSTFIGGLGADVGNSIAVDSSNNAYITGSTTSGNYPTTAFFGVGRGGMDAVVSKLTVAGGLVYSVQLIGGGDDLGRGIALDSARNAYVAGRTASTNFPRTAGAFDTTHNGMDDVFVSKIDPTGTALVYSTFVGGSSIEYAFAIDVDLLGSAYITGVVVSADFPITPDAFDPTLINQDAFLFKLNTAGGAPLEYSTYIGGNEGIETGYGIAVDATGNAFVTGVTGSLDFPITSGAFDGTNADNDAFLTKLIFEGPPADMTLEPLAAINHVGTQHCVTAHVTDALANPNPGVTVRFSASGASTKTGSVTTDGNGQAVFCYVGPLSAGDDTITAFADTNGDGIHDAGEPGATASKEWVYPPPSARCLVFGSGVIRASNGDWAGFVGYALVSGATMTGVEIYQDIGPAAPLAVRSISIQNVSCDGKSATVLGQATVNGTGAHDFAMFVSDLAQPGAGADKYRLLLETGYDSGEQTLATGDLQIITW